MLARQRERALRQARTPAQRAEIDRAFGEQLDRYLDAGYGSAILTAHGAVVADALKYFDGQRYQLDAWCVMPNHVHVLICVPGRAELDRILHSWKSFTAHQIGLGVIWQREYFDRIVRGGDELERLRQYIRANPLRAGLMDWPFVS